MTETFSEIYSQFLSKQESNRQDCFTAACILFLSFDTTRAPSARLAILYVLYSCYATAPLENNPFLTFFLQLLEELPAKSVEQHFVYCILEETLSRIGDALPQDVYNEPDSKLPAIQMDQNLVDSLRLKVARLIDDPDLVILNEQTRQLLSDACCRILSLAENETLRNERLSDYPLTDYIAPHQLPSLVDLNHFLALSIVPLLLKTSLADAYLQALLEAPITLNSIEVVHHALVNNVQVSQEFLHYFISKSIRSCDEKPRQDRKVKLVRPELRAYHFCLLMLSLRRSLGLFNHSWKRTSLR
ncbi:hypothetical protein PS15p_201039 [Mucor circinelloides]